MEIKLYYNKSDMNHVTKNIQLIATLDGVFKTEQNILAPTLILNISDSDMLSSNYAYIPTLKRYYYINSITILRDGVYELECSVDVLMTYRPWILNQSGIIGRQEKVYDTTITDNRLTVRNNSYVQTLQFPRGFSQSANDYTYVMVFAGNNTDIQTTPPGE